MRHHHPNARTVAVVRLLTALGPLPHRRRARIPPQAQPDGVRRAYYAAVLPHVRRAQSAFHGVRQEIVRLLQDERAAQGKTDADRGAQARALVDRAARRAAAAFEPTELRAVARRFGKQTSDFQRAQLDKQVRAAMGVPLAMVEKPTTDKIEGFAAVNVDLIRTVPERYFDRIRQDVTDAFASGMHPETLAQRLVDRDGMADDDARRIARDQIGKLAAEVNEERQKAIGVTGYTWRGSMDNRERDNHRGLEGEHFEWDDPPMGGGTSEDEEGHPGSGINCRCTAEPDFGEILGDLG